MLFSRSFFFKVISRAVPYGRLIEFEIFAGLSTNPSLSVAKGSIALNQNQQVIPFPATLAQYVRLNFISQESSGGNAYAAVADLIFGTLNPGGDSTE